MAAASVQKVESQISTTEDAPVVVELSGPSADSGSACSDDSDVEPSGPNEEQEEQQSLRTKPLIVNWSLNAIALGDPKDPTARKRTEVRNPITPPAKRSAGMIEPSTSHSAPGVASKSSTLTIQPFIASTQSWPDRSKLPSIRDIVGYRQTVPNEATLYDIGQLTGLKFGWGNKLTYTSEQYVTGVVLGHDQARRSMIDEIHKYLSARPTTPQEAMNRWDGMLQWVEEQKRPPTPDQPFEP